MAIPDLLSRLLDAAGPSGFEGPVAAVWRAAAAEFAEVHVDSLGTSFARVRAAAGAPALAVVGHIDEVGFQVTHIDDKGLLAVAVIGGFAPEMLAGQRVVLAGRAGPLAGVVGRRRLAPARRGDQPRLELADLHLDIGATSREEAAALVEPGASGVWLGEPALLAHGRLASRALDNRLGAYAALEAARRVAAAGDAAFDVVAVASVQEEIGHHGARTAAFALEPRVALILDVTHATDVPGGDPKLSGAVALGDGAAITRGPVANARVSELLLEAAREEGIPHCVEVESGATHTDADAVHVARAGVPTGLVSIPLRYMHSPCELCALDDLEAVVRLVVAFARRLGAETSFLR